MPWYVPILCFVCSSLTPNETAITHLLGPIAGIIAAVLICLVVAGSLLGNSFVAGRMIVAASNSNWLPRFLGILGQLGSSSDENHASARPSHSDTPSSKSDAPINAIVLSTALPIFYILFGDFRALLTFNGLGEYTFFLLTVLGAIILRFREPDLRRPYKPSIIIPITFAIVSGFVVVRGAIFAPVQALVLLSLWIIGAGYYEVRRRWAVSRNV